MRAEILCIGSELLLGDIADTNTQYLAQRLSALGIDLYFSTAVGDNQPRVVDCLKRAVSRSDLVLTTGGLGPTDDDVTRESIAQMFGETPVVDEELARHLREFFALRGLAMTENNLKQASLIPSARAVHNSRGTAPGWWVEKDGQIIIAMPGPPGELHNIWETEVEPALRVDESSIFSRTLKLFAISESLVDNLLKNLTPEANPTVAVYAKQDGIHVRITAKAPTRREAEAAIAPIEIEVRRLLGQFIWGADRDTQEGVVADLLRSMNARVALFETVTGGQLSSMLSAVAEPGTILAGAKVHHGLSSSDSRELAREAIRLFGAEIGVATTGRAIDAGEHEMHEITVSVIWPDKGLERTEKYGSRSHRARQLGAYYAIHELRKLLLGAG